MIERSAALPQMLKINPSASIGGRGGDDRIICRVASGAKDKPVSEQWVCVWMGREGGDRTIFRFMHGSILPVTIPPPGNPGDKSCPSVPGVGNCLKRSCPGGRGAGQIEKINFLLFRFSVDNGASLPISRENL